MSAPVDVLAVLGDIAEETRGAIGWPGCRELATRLDEAHAAIAELIEADRWREFSQEVGLPPHGERVLVAFEAGRHFQTAVGIWWQEGMPGHDFKSEWELEGHDYLPKVVAWKPLPTFAALRAVSGEVQP